MADHTPAGPGSQPIVHLVCESQFLRQLLGRLLEHHGLRCRSYSSTEELLGRRPAGGRGAVILFGRLDTIERLFLEERLRSTGLDVPLVVLPGDREAPSDPCEPRLSALLEKRTSQILIERIRRLMREHAGAGEVRRPDGGMPLTNDRGW